jgi:NAD(P)-dependent dehydrogenase (short-subunit alcohol dehydrogenase family)
MTNPMDLRGRNVLVSGASSGIGRATAILLSELGACVVLVGRDSDRLQQTLSAMQPGGHRVEPFDLSRSEEIPKWMQSIAAETGPLHGLVHAAGKQAAMPIRFATESRVDELMRTNLYSAIMLARGYSHKSCRPADGGSIVFLSSVMAFLGKPAISVYGATKAALVGLTKSLAVELAPERVRVNCLAPGFVETEMFDQARAVMTDEQVTALQQAHPLGFGTARDVANAAAFLIADTGRWITGSTLVLDGGYSAQ